MSNPLGFGVAQRQFIRQRHLYPDFFCHRQRLATRLRRSFVQAQQKHHKLIAPEPGHGVTHPHMGAQSASHFLQQQVTRHVSMPVVGMRAANPSCA